MTAPRSANANRNAGVVLLVAVVIVALGVSKGTIHLGRDQIIFFAALIPSVILHEVSHGAVAYLFGDDTAKRAGRLTLNPIAHIDPFGTIILPAILILTAGSAFGYARPVPVSPSRMRSPRNHGLLTSLAGPAVNIVLVVLTLVVMRSALSNEYQIVGNRIALRDNWLLHVVYQVGLVNVFLAVFNLIPIPPLDGSAVVERLLPARLWPSYLRIRQYGMLFLFVLIFWSGGVLSKIFDPAVRFWFSLLRH